MKPTEVTLPRITKTKRGFTCRYGNLCGMGKTEKEAFSALIQKLFDLQIDIKSYRRENATHTKRIQQLEEEKQALQESLKRMEAQHVGDIAKLEAKHKRDLYEKRAIYNQQALGIQHVNELRTENHSLIMENNALKKQLKAMEKK